MAIKVKQLIEMLEKLPQDAAVFIYNESSEDDFPVTNVTHTLPIIETYDGDEYYYSPCGCQGDSYVEEYWGDYGPDKDVVILH